MILYQTKKISAQKTNQQPTKQEKMFSSHISENDCYLQYIQKNPLNSITENQNNPIKIDNGCK
jgi:hypothetical protein